MELLYIKDVLYISWVIDKSTTWRNDECDFYLSSNRDGWEVMLGRLSIEVSLPKRFSKARKSISW